MEHVFEEANGNVSVQEEENGMSFADEATAMANRGLRGLQSPAWRAIHARFNPTQAPSPANFTARGTRPSRTCEVPLVSHDWWAAFCASAAQMLCCVSARAAY